MRDKVKGAVETYQTTGFNCAQSVLSEFAPQFGLDRDTAMKLACGFGSGMGRSGNMCGAVTSGILVLGLKNGMMDPESQEDKEKTYEEVVRLL
jgi:C_GCAxxG_C_C family probable redox protein